MFNHNTDTNDTIQANSQEELQQQVIDTSDQDDSPTNISVAVSVTLGFVVVLIIIVIYAKRKNGGYGK